MALIAPNHEPTPEEIAQRCAEIQEMWTPEECYRRTLSFDDTGNRASVGDDHRERYTVPVICTADLRDARTA